MNTGAAACCLLLIINSPLYSQTPAAAASPSAENSVPLAEVAGRLTELNRMLRSIDDQLVAGSDQALVTEELRVMGESLADEAKQVKDTIVQSLTLQDIELIENEWRSRLDNLDQWKQNAGRRARDFEESLQRLENEQVLWEETLKQYRTAAAPEVIIERIVNALAEIRREHALVEEGRRKALILQNQISPQELLVSEVLDEAERAKMRLHRSLLTRDSPPLWKVWSGTAGPAPFLSIARQSLSQQLDEIKRLVSAKWLSLLLIIALYFAAVAGALFLSRKLSVWTAGQIGLDSSIFHEHPIAIALISATLGSFWLPAFAPVRLSGLVNSLLLIVLLLSLSPLLPRLIRPFLMMLAAVYAAHRICTVFLPLPEVERIITAVSMAVAIAGVLWLTRPARLRRFAKQEGAPVTYLLIVWLIAILLATSLIANLFGYLALARVIGRGAISSLALAVILYSTARTATIGLSLLLQTRWMQSFASLRQQGEKVYRWISRLIFIFAWIIWGYSSLTFFTVNDEAGRVFNYIFKTNIELGAIQFTISDVAAFLLVVGISIAISRAVRFFLQEDVLSKVELQRGLANAILTTIQYGLLFVGFLVAMGVVGLDLTRFTVLAGAFGVGIGFGLQNIFNNFISGLILLYERPIRLDDLVEIGGVTGQVKRIGIRSSSIRTAQGADVIVPNSNLISSQFINWTHSDQLRRLEIKVGVAYGADPEKILKLLLEAATAHPKVRKEPAPMALFRGFGDSSLNFEVRVWVHHTDLLIVETEVGVAIAAALARGGIEIPFPQRNLKLRSIDQSLKETLDQPPSSKD